MIQLVRTRNFRLGAPLLWCACYALMYALRLPAYQHARYLMPVMPILTLLGLHGYLECRRLYRPAKYRWVFEWTLRSGLLLLTGGFLVLGARAYGEDVGLIESEMVETANWVARNIEADAVIAAHDIGALGYFDHHRLVDLAGLVSPEVIPFLHDEDRLAEILDERGAGYLVAFPNLYPRLAANSELLHQSGGRFALAAGQGNMTVYCWRCP